jgi:streptomycin 6-kinase
MDAAPFDLAGIEAYSGQAEWEAGAATMLGTMLERWKLRSGEVFTAGVAGTTVAVTREDGDSAVLKLGFPHAEAVWEAVGLQLMPAGLAPRVLRQDVWTWALLLETVRPGTALSEHPLPATEALAIGGRLLAELSLPLTADSPLPTVAEMISPLAERMRAGLDGHREALDALAVTEQMWRGTEELADLLRDTGESRLVHGDFNPGNILDAGAGRWVVIDPKPMRGDPSFDLAPLVAQLGSPFSGAEPWDRLAEQLAIAATAAGLDATRSARWGFARGALSLSWYLDDGSHELAATEAAELLVWERLLA